VVASWTITGFIIFVSGILMTFYRHRGRRYADGKAVLITSSDSMRWIFRYLQVSTFVIGVASQWSDHPILLKVYHVVWVSFVGVGIATAGLTVFIWAKLSIGRSYSPCFDSLLPQTLVSVGPYRWVRHPIYTGNILLLLGLFLASSSMWLMFNLGILAVYYFRAAMIEERVLTQQFPEYADLIARTGRFLPKKNTANR